jgi:hypothetical protein
MQFSEPMRSRLTSLLGEAGAVLVEITAMIGLHAIVLLSIIAVLITLIVADVLALQHAFTMSGSRGTREQALVLIINLTVFVILLRAFRRTKFKRLKYTENVWQEPEQGVEIPSDQDNWWTVLGVSPDAGLNDIRRNYLTRIQQYHPDRVAGLAPAVRELAETRSKKLNAAYAAAMRERRGLP